MNVGLCRHGAATDEKQGTVTVAHGWDDSGLTEEGRAESRKVAQWAVTHGFAACPIYCSDLRRAVETAKIVSVATGGEVLPTWGWRTWDIGTLAGQPEEYVHSVLRLFIQHGRTPPGGESFPSFVTRVQGEWAALTSLRVPCVLVITHTRVTRVVMEIQSGRDPVNADQYTAQWVLKDHPPQCQVMTV